MWKDPTILGITAFNENGANSNKFLPCNYYFVILSSPRISKWFHVDGSMASNIQSLDSLWSKMVSTLYVEMDSSERESQRSGVYHSSGSYGWKYLAFRSLELFHSNWLIWMTISEFIPWLWFLEQLFVWGSIHYIRVFMTFLRIILTIY